MPGHKGLNLITITHERRQVVPMHPQVQTFAAHRADERGFSWVTDLSWAWFVTTTIFSVYIGVSQAYQSNHLDEFGDPTGDLGVGLVGPIYLLLLMPALAIATVISTGIDLHTHRRMHPRNQRIRQLTMIAAILTPIVTVAAL